MPGWVRRADSATAMRVSTAMTGRLKPKASPWARAQAVRKPVKAPGPCPKAIACTSDQARPACASKAFSPGKVVVDAWAAPPRACTCT